MKISILSFMLLIALPVHAEFALCNGAYTNKPCTNTTPTPTVGGEPIASSTETLDVQKSTAQSGSSVTPHPSKTPTAPPFSERYTIIRNIKKLSDEHKATGKVNLSNQELDEIRLLCQNPNIAYAECKKRSDALEQDLKERNSKDDKITLQGDDR